MIVAKGSEEDQFRMWLEKLMLTPEVYDQGAGLKVGTSTYEYDDSVAEGKVISQSVTPGKKVSAGTAVDIVVSSGKETEEYRCRALSEEMRKSYWIGHIRTV